MTFIQTAPTLTNTWRGDASLQLHLHRLLGPEVFAELAPDLDAMGERAAGEMMPLAEHAENNPPRLVHYGPYGDRIDRIETPSSWKTMGKIAAEAGLIAIPHEAKHGALSRVHQFAMLLLYSPSSAIFSCPLAMSDGAVAALRKYGADNDWAKRAVDHLMSRDPDKAWTSGQWMTEKEGGSDVGRSSTVARFEDGVWRLYGTKYFTSATTSECTLTLARPEGAASGSRGLSMFFVEPWNADGTSNNIRVRRLKEKLGTRALPTAELELEGTVAHAVGDLDGGLRKISTVLNIARYFNTMAAISGMARGQAFARSYADVREAFGHKLIDLPLHVETLAAMQVDYEAALAVGVRLAELLGRVEQGTATDTEKGAWRFLTPLAKLGTGKQAVAHASETLEAFGGAGYMEDTGLPRILRDAQVLPIWEGTTNVLSLDALRAIARENGLEALIIDMKKLISGCTHPLVHPIAEQVHAAAGQIVGYARKMGAEGMFSAQTGARAFCLSIYRTYAAALLCHAAEWEVQNRPTRRHTIAAKRWTARGLVHLIEPDKDRHDESRALLG